MNNNNTRYAVLGAGNGGRAMAAHLALMGFDVNLFNRTFAHIAAIQACGGIELESNEGELRGFGKLRKTTSDIQEALTDVDMIMVVVPSSAHVDIARTCAPYLQSGQTIILHPGRTGGALEFRKTLHDLGCQADITIAETQTFIYASRAEGETQARIFRIKETVTLAALPAMRTQAVLDAICPAYPQFIDGIDVLHTSLNNIGAVFHPAITLLNAGWIEATHGGFQFYVDGVTPSVGELMDAVDRERIAVAAAMGIRAYSAIEWLETAYDSTGTNLYEAIQNQSGYYGIKAPNILQHRYISEDVPMGLVPIAAMGQRYGVSVPAMESLICLADTIHQTDYWQRGRTLGKLGIQDLSPSELTNYVREEMDIYIHPPLPLFVTEKTPVPERQNWQGDFPKAI